MTDTEDNTVSVVEEDAGQATPPTMAEPQDLQHQQQEPQHEPKKPEKMNISFSIWPPTQRTRDAVINRLIETLSTPSVLSKRYGTIPAGEASAAARLIEEEAFSAAGSAGADDDGIEVLQVYSKEISKRMLEAVKSRAASGSTPDNGTPQTPVVGPTATSEEISAVETESS